jgi:hypothetical protein
MMLLFGVLLVQKYNLYFPDKLPINVNTKGLAIVAIALPFILIPLYFIYNALFGSKIPASQAAPST